jgi:hypothetical protein
MATESSESTTTEVSPTPSPGVCEHCREPLTQNETGEWLCANCSDRQRILWIMGIALLFFCFVVLPMMIQLIGTPPPPREIPLNK